MMRSLARRTWVAALLGTALLLAGLGVGAAHASSGTGEVQVPLIAGQHHNAGIVRVWSDATTIYVRYEASGGWYLKETHVQISASAPTGNQAPGLFAYKADHASEPTTYTHEVPLGSFGADDVVYGLAHAVVGKAGHGSEGAWGGDIPRSGKGQWYYYFSYQITGAGATGEGDGGSGEQTGGGQEGTGGTTEGQGQGQTQSTPSGTITVTVVKSDGSNVGGLAVSISGAVSSTIHTGSSGTASLTGLVAGNYAVNAADDGYTSDGPRYVELASDTASGGVTITLEPLALSLGDSTEDGEGNEQEIAELAEEADDSVLDLALASDAPMGEAGEPAVATPVALEEGRELPVTGFAYMQSVLLGLSLVALGTALSISGRRRAAYSAR